MVGHIGFTGTQKGMTPPQKEAVAYLFDSNLYGDLHHGDCIGADRDAHTIASSLRMRIHIHPPEIEHPRAWCQGYYAIYDPKPYLERNSDIVLATSVLIATPFQFYELLRSGTWATVRRARKAKKRIHIVWPDGRWTTEGGEA